MKKAVLLSISIITIIIMICLIGIRFTPRRDVFLGEYSVTEDGRRIEMEVGVASSMGYIGRYTTKKSGNSLYVKFYSSLTGHNTISGGNLLTIDLFTKCDAIYFNRSKKEYQIILQKNSETNTWERVIE